MRSSVLVGRILACLIGLGLAAPALAGGSAQGASRTAAPAAAVELPAGRRVAPDDGTMPDWPERLARSERRVRETRRDAEAASHDYRKARARKYPRGGNLRSIRDRVDSTRIERDSAEAEFSKLVEAARRDGVPPGTLMPFMDLRDEIQRLRADRSARGEK